MKSSNSLLAVALAIASLSFTVSVKADTVNARCDVFPKGEDRTTSSGPGSGIDYCADVGSVILSF